MSEEEKNLNNESQEDPTYVKTLPKWEGNTYQVETTSEQGMNVCQTETKENQYISTTNCILNGQVKDGTPKAEAVLDQIYNRLSGIFGGDGMNNVFCMEFPGRVLNEKLYSFNPDNIFAELKKPQTVLEQEFRLTNDLFDISIESAGSSERKNAQVVAGPNGIRLSDAYATALNAIVPKWNVNKQFIEDQKKIRNWLLEKVVEVIDGVTYNCSRIELFEKLNNRYLNQKANWEWYKSEKFKEAKAKGTEDALEDYSKWLARESVVQQNIIDGYFSDLLTRGYYHEVTGNMAYLDVTSVSESMYEAKNVLRHIAMSALDESQIVYPVQMQPNDWFRALSTDFQSEDLLYDVSYLGESLIKKQAELETSEKRLANLSSRQNDYELRLTTLKENIEKETESINRLNEELYALYDKTLIESVGLAIKSTGFINTNKSDEEKIKVADAAKVAISAALGKPLDHINIGISVISQIWNSSLKIEEHRSKIETVSRNLSQLMLSKAENESLDSYKEIETLSKRVVMLQKEIVYLKEILDSSFSNEYITQKQQLLANIATRKGKINDNEIGVTVKKEVKMDDSQIELEEVLNRLADATAINSTSEITILNARKTTLETIIEEIRKEIQKSEIEEWRKTIKTLEAEEAKKNKISLKPIMPPPSRWTDITMSFTKEEVNSESQLTVSSSSTNVDLKFGFFHAGGKKSTYSMNFWDKLKTADTTIQLGFRATKVTINRGWLRPQFFRMTKAMYKLLEGIDISSNPSKITDVLPAYPISFLVVKDVTIKYSNVQKNRSDIKSMLESSSNSSAGFICFSAETSDHLKSESKAFHWSYTDDTVTIRIPGPQVLAWFLNKILEDVSTPYNSVPNYYL